MRLSSDGNAEMLFIAAQVFHRFHSDSYLLTVLHDLDRLMYVGNKLFSSSKLGLKDGWKLIAECEKDGLMPDLITWAGVLDIAVGLAAQRIWQEEAKGAKGGIKGEDAQKILETMRTKGVFGDPERASPLYNRWVLEMQDIMREADPGNSWGG